MARKRNFRLASITALLPVTGKVADLWGVMAAQAQMKGIALSVIDGLLAATAKTIMDVV
jgi:predicted nucleic acid-binding protein